MKELVLSTDIEREIANRNKIIELVQAAAVDYGFRLDSSHVGYEKLNLDRIRMEIDREYWLKTLDKSGLSNLMSERMKGKARSSLNREVPEFSLENVMASFGDFGSRISEIENEGLVDLFKGMSWDHKTNRPVRLGKKIIYGYGFSNDRWSKCYYLTTNARDRLIDLKRVAKRLLGKSIPPVQNTLGQEVYRHFIYAKSKDRGNLW